MLREIESYRPQAQLLDRLQSMFPTVNISPPCPSASITESLDVHSLFIKAMIRSLPRPNSNDTFQTISSMKSIVDGQELRIQINMMELDEPEYASQHPMMKKVSMATRCEEEDERDELNMGEWSWKGRDF